MPVPLSGYRPIISTPLAIINPTPGQFPMPVPFDFDQGRCRQSPLGRAEGALLQDGAGLQGSTKDLRPAK